MTEITPGTVCYVRTTGELFFVLCTNMLNLRQTQVLVDGEKPILYELLPPPVGDGPQSTTPILLDAEQFSGIVVTGRIAKATDNDGIRHVISSFLLEELESFMEKAAREHAEFMRLREMTAPQYSKPLEPLPVEVDSTRNKEN